MHEDDAAALREADGVDVDGRKEVLEHGRRQLHVPLFRLPPPPPPPSHVRGADRKGGTFGGSGLHVVEDDERRREELGGRRVRSALRRRDVTRKAVLFNLHRHLVIRIGVAPWYIEGQIKTRRALK